MHSRTNIKIFMFVLCVLTAGFLSCTSKNEKAITFDELLGIKSKYNKDAINYFYETVFHEDFKRVNLDHLSNWKTNPKIVLAGSPSEKEIGYVQNAILEINKLDIALKCSLGNKTEANAIEIFFGNPVEVATYLKADSLIQNQIDTTAHFGLAHPVSYDGVIKEAYIGICFSKTDTQEPTRELVVLEEIIQSLGVFGDSYNYPGSLFFQNDNHAKSFTKLDKDVLSMLYDPAVPEKYSRVSFEKDFADVLFHVNPSEKIQQLLNHFPKELNSGGDVAACFTKEQLLKHPKEVKVYLNGSMQKGDYSVVTKAITSINQLSPNLKMSIMKAGTKIPDYGIALTFKQADQQTEAIKRTIEVIQGKDCMFPKLIKSKVLLSFNVSEKSAKFRQQSIIDALYFSLLQIPQHRLGKDGLFTMRNGVIIFNQHYADLLKLIYSDEFIDGLKLSDYEVIDPNI